MKLSLNWLKDYIDPKLPTDTLIHRLVMAGWEVENVDVHGKDAVFELEITPNRPDCLNILGLAREIGAITAKKVKYPKITSHKSSKEKILIEIQDKKDCSRYIGTVIKNVHINSSPSNIKERIEALGINSISNAVDITNFVLMETGQPLHVFDYDKIIGGKIIVRRAKAGEKIVTLDGIERSLDPSILVIADEKRPIAIAGLMGGKDTEVTAQTKNILLESAYFDMTLIRRASRKLGLRSDSSYRFERNVDFNGVLTGANRATDLLLELTKGKLSVRTDIAHAPKLLNTMIKISASDVENLLGNKISTAQIKRILTSLDFKVTGVKDPLSVKAPCFRGDIKQTVDLIEEVARIIGFDQMPTSLPHIKARNSISSDKALTTKRLIRQTLQAQGLSEAITLSMISFKDLEKCQKQDMKVLKVFNPLTLDQEIKRPSLLPSLLKVAVTNINRGQRDIKIFEIGKRYLHEGEKETLGILMTGKRHEDWRASRKELVEFFDLKGAVESLACHLGVSISIEANPSRIFDEASSGRIMFEGKEIGSLGKVRREILSNWEIKNQDVYFAGLHLDAILALPKKINKYQTIIEFPAVVRDVSVAVNKEITYEAIKKICRQYGSTILRDVKFIELYAGDKISANQKALVFSLVYQSQNSTLREEEVASTHETIVNALIKELGAIRR